jgi:hypothetical protein
VQAQIYNLKRKYDETVFRNLETHKACALLTHEIKQLRREATEIGAQLDEDTHNGGVSMEM